MVLKFTQSGRFRKNYTWFEAARSLINLMRNKRLALRLSIDRVNEFICFLTDISFFIPDLFQNEQIGI